VGKFEVLCSALRECCVEPALGANNRREIVFVLILRFLKYNLQLKFL